MSLPTSFKTEHSPASFYAASEPQTPNDSVVMTDFAQLSVDDEKGVEVKTAESGSYAMDVAKGKNEGYASGIERYTPPFVRNAPCSQGDDPFYQLTTPANKPRPGRRTPNAPNPYRKIGIMSNDWRSGSVGSDDESVSFTPVNSRSRKQDTNRKLSFAGLMDAAESLDSGLAGFSDAKSEDPQSAYPPSGCIFVANLLQTETDEFLQVAVTQIFRDYGPVYVKIRRDVKGMPFAFCQYTVPEHADRAIIEGRGRLIKGRPCRCEKAKAHRLFFVERKYGPTVTPEEVRELLGSYGSIDFCYTPTVMESTALDLGLGVIIQFQMYDDGQAAQTAFRNHDVWKLVGIAGLATGLRASATGNSPPPSASDASRAYLERYEVDRRSIFVGNLPAGTAEDQLKDLFGQHGFIQEIVLRESASKYDSREKFCFAFIEFKSPMAVSNALAVKNCLILGGRNLRVAQKDSENGARRSARVPFRAPVSPTPAARTAGLASFAAPPVPAAPAAMYPSPVPLGVEQHVSPMSPMAPPLYGPPYAYSYNPFYSYGPTSTIYSDGPSYYQSPAYSPGYYPYTGSPGYWSADTVYQYPAPYWGMPTASVGYQAPPLAAPSYPTQMEISPVEDDRSVTAAPAELAPAELAPDVDTPMESE